MENKLETDLCTSLNLSEEPSPRNCFHFDLDQTRGYVSVPLAPNTRALKFRADERLRYWRRALRFAEMVESEITIADQIYAAHKRFRIFAKGEIELLQVQAQKDEKSWDRIHDRLDNLGRGRRSVEGGPVHYEIPRLGVALGSQQESESLSDDSELGAVPVVKDLTSQNWALILKAFREVYSVQASASDEQWGSLLAALNSGKDADNLRAHMKSRKISLSAAQMKKLRNVLKILEAVGETAVAAKIRSWASKSKTTP